MMTRYRIASEKAWGPLCRDLIATYRHGAVILLRGTLGSGKSTFVKAFAKELGLPDDVSSPTFAVMHHYGSGEKQIFHYDIYNKTYGDFMAMGLMEQFGEPGWHLVEWGSDEFGRLLQMYGYSYMAVDISILTEGRAVEVTHA